MGNGFFCDEYFQLQFEQCPLSLHLIETLTVIGREIFLLAESKIFTILKLPDHLRKISSCG
jgi:hypothetical protein